MNNAIIDTLAMKLAGTDAVGWITSVPQTQKAYWRELVRQMFSDYNRMFDGD